MPSNRTLMVLPGDGVGPEVVKETLRVVDWFAKNKSISFNLKEGLVGGASFDKYGTPLSDETLADAIDADAILFHESTFYRQAAWFGVGVFVFAVVQFVRVQYLYDSSYFLFFVLFLLIFSTIYSPVINGAQSWIVFGPFSFQPSEVGKVIYVIFLARFFTDFNDKTNII